LKKKGEEKENEAAAARVHDQRDELLQQLLVQRMLQGKAGVWLPARRCRASEREAVCARRTARGILNFCSCSWHGSGARRFFVGPRARARRQGRHALARRHPPPGSVLAELQKESRVPASCMSWSAFMRVASCSCRSTISAAYVRLSRSGSRPSACAVSTCHTYVRLSRSGSRPSACAASASPARAAAVQARQQDDGGRGGRDGRARRGRRWTVLQRRLHY
jgi:hypothetical protein